MKSRIALLGIVCATFVVGCKTRFFNAYIPCFYRPNWCVVTGDDNARTGFNRRLLLFAYRATDGDMVGEKPNRSQIC